MSDQALISWKKRLQLVQLVIVVFYGASISFPITYSWVALIAGIVLWIPLAAISIRQRRRETKDIRRAIGEEFKVPPLTIPLAVFVVVATISGALNGGLREAFYSFISFRALLVYFWAYQAFRDHVRARLFAVQGALLVGAVGGLWGTIQQVFNIHPTDYRYLQGTGFMFSPMSFSGLMQILGCLALGILLYREKAYSTFSGILCKLPVYAAIAVSNVLGVVFASERSGWIGAIAGSIVVMACASLKTLLKGAVVCTILAAIAWSTIPVFQQRLEPLMHWQNDVSTRVRVQVWGEAINLFKKKPLLGVGIRKFPHLYIKEAVVPGHTDYLDHAHSNYFQLLATMGAIGLLAYFYLCIATLILLVKSFRNPSALPFDRGVALGLLGSMVSLMVAGLFEFNFGTGQVRLAQWFVLALVSLNRQSAAIQFDAIAETDSTLTARQIISLD